MKKILLPLFVSLLSISSIWAQGSGKCLLYNGTSNYTEIPDNPLFSSHAGGQMTIEAWVKVLAVNTDGHNQVRQPIIVKGRPHRWEWALYIYDDLRAGFSSWQCSGSGHNEVSGGSIVLNKWHHIAASFDDGNFNKVYIDGVLVANKTTFSGSACDRNRPVRIASREDGQYLNAYIDEIRIWNKALTQTEIRNNMCQKLTGTEANLTANFRIDEGINNTCGTTEDICDISSNAFKGTNRNNPTWVNSGAAIGDKSTYLYTNSWAGATINLASANRGNVEINNVTNNPEGIHLYRVDQVPNSTVGITKTLGSNDTYYGTFVAHNTWGGTYDIVYDYSNYPDAVNDENDLILYHRADNSVLNWTDNGATLNTVANTLTSFGENARGEYVIALSSGALPVTFSYFDVFKDQTGVVSLNWETLSEINSNYFDVQRSLDATHWKTIETIDAAGYSNETIQYHTSDKPTFDQVIYYRLKQVDFNGTFIFSEVKSVTKDSPTSNIRLYPNPAKDNITIENQFSILENIHIYNMVGKEVSNRVIASKISDHKVIIDISDLTQGFYTVSTNKTTRPFFKK